MPMGYKSIHNIEINGYIVHHQMLATEFLKAWLHSHGIASQMPADHSDRTVVLAHTCILF